MTTGNNLKSLARRANKYRKSLALLIFPEGTLVSALTKPKSAKYADKMNIVRLGLVSRSAADNSR